MAPWKLGQLVEEEHTVVGQRSLSRDRVAAASADKGGLGCGVMGRAKGRSGSRPRRLPAAAHSIAVSIASLDLEAGKQSPDPTSEHGLARAGRAMQEEVMAAGGRYLQRPSRHELAPDVGQVEAPEPWRACPGPGRAPSRRGPHEAGPPPRRGCSRRRSGPRESRLPPRRPPQRRAGDVLAGTEDRGAECVVPRPHPAIERELADHHCSSQHRDVLAGGEDAECDRKVVVGASLGKVGWGQVHRHRPVGEAETRRGAPRPGPGPSPRGQRCRAGRTA